MGATSVTGVSGSGSVDGSSKGSEHMSMGNKKIVGPVVWYAGTATLSGGGTVSLDIPTLPGSASDYVAFANSTNSTVGAVNVTGLTTTALALKGTASHVVNWCIVKKGF